MNKGNIRYTAEYNYLGVLLTKDGKDDRYVLGNRERTDDNEQIEYSYVE